MVAEMESLARRFRQQGHALAADLLEDSARSWRRAGLVPGQLAVDSDEQTLFEYLPDRHSVRVDGQERMLTRVEDRVMTCLADNSNRIVSQEELLSTVWGPERSKTVVEKGINRLRAKIESDPQRPSRIVSIRGQGYVFRAVTSLSEAEIPALVSRPAPEPAP